MLRRPLLRFPAVELLFDGDQNTSVEQDSSLTLCFCVRDDWLRRTVVANKRSISTATKILEKKIAHDWNFFRILPFKHRNPPNFTITSFHRIEAVITCIFSDEQQISAASMNFCGPFYLMSVSAKTTPPSIRKMRGYQIIRL